MQLFDDDFADQFAFDVLDATKLIPEEDVPIRIVGRLVLDRRVDNFFAETEQVAFCTQNVVPGIDFTNDPLLQGRNFSYLDTQISRLGGPNFHELPINAPLAAVHNNQRDAMHRQAIPRGRVAYEPNSLGGGCPFQAGLKGFVSFAPAITFANTPVDKVRGKPEKFAEHYNQATLFFNSQSAVEKAHIIGAFRFELSKVTVPAIRLRMLSSLLNVSAELAAAVAQGLGLALPPAMPKVVAKRVKPEVEISPPLSLMALPGTGGVATRKVAILITAGVDVAAIETVQNELTKVGVVTRYLGITLGAVKGADGRSVEADATIENSPSVLFDGVVIPNGSGMLAKLGQPVEFLQNQFRHCKTILAMGDAVTILEKAGIPTDRPDGGLLVVRAGSIPSKEFIAALAKHRHPDRDQDPPPV